MQSSKFSGRFPFPSLYTKKCLLTEASLGVVEVPGHCGIAVTRYFRLQAKGRLRSCWNERGSGSVVRMLIKLHTRTTTRIPSLPGLQRMLRVWRNIRLKRPFENLLLNRIMNVARVYVKRICPHNSSLRIWYSGLNSETSIRHPRPSSVKNLASSTESCSIPVRKSKLSSAIDTKQQGINSLYS